MKLLFDGWRALLFARTNFSLYLIKQKLIHAIWYLQARLGLVKARKYGATLSAKKDITFIIAHKDCAQFLKINIDSIRRNTKKYTYQICVVDDGSSEQEFAQVLSIDCDDLAIYKFDRGHGHPFTMEWMYRRCNTPYVVLLDQDTMIVSDVWEDIIQQYQQQPQLLLIGVRDLTNFRYSPQMLHPSFIVFDRERCQKHLKGALFFGARKNYADYKIGQPELCHSLTCKALASDKRSIAYLDTYPTKYGKGSIGYYRDSQHRIFYHQWFSGRIYYFSDNQKIDGADVSLIRDGINLFFSDYTENRLDFSSVES